MHAFLDLLLAARIDGITLVVFLHFLVLCLGLEIESQRGRWGRKQPALRSVDSASGEEIDCVDDVVEEGLAADVSGGCQAERN